MKKHARTSFIIFVGCLLVGTLSQCLSSPEPAAAVPAPAQGFAGTAACANCHKNIHDSYEHTAHNRSSAPALKETVMGSFEPGANAYFYRPDVKVVMQQRDSGLYQAAYKDGEEKQSNRFDVVMGSGRKAQTYLYWLNDRAYQLPVSYFVPAASWANSPGYPPHQVRFDRNIPSGCFQCHSTYIKVSSNSVEGDRIVDHFDRNSVVYGISCERCHGAAAKHVSFHQQNPLEKAPQFIASYRSLTRQQQTDVCASCHSGIQEPLQSIFYFRPGDTLAGHFFTPSAPVNAADLDVHGNQTQLLAASKCFINNKTLTCSSCHNTHDTERDNTALFSRRCINCHSNTTHRFDALATREGISISNNCIDCHMPAKPSRVISLLSNGQASPTPALVRTHLIKIYPDETKKFLSHP